LEEQEESKGQGGNGHEHNCDRHEQSRGLFPRYPRYDAGDLALVSTLVGLLRAAGDLRGARKELVRYEAAVRQYRSGASFAEQLDDKFALRIAQDSLESVGRDV